MITIPRYVKIKYFSKFVIKTNLNNCLQLLLILKAKRRNNGEVWTQPSGRKVTKKNGKILPVSEGKIPRNTERRKEKKKMETEDDVRKFIKDMFFKENINFHPDNDFNDYKNISKEKAEKYNKLLDKAWNIVGEKIYDIASDLQDQAMGKGKNNDTSNDKSPLKSKGKENIMEDYQKEYRDAERKIKNLLSKVHTFRNQAMVDLALDEFASATSSLVEAAKSKGFDSSAYDENFYNIRKQALDYSSKKSASNADLISHNYKKYQEAKSPEEKQQIINTLAEDVLEMEHQTDGGYDIVDAAINDFQYDKKLDREDLENYLIDIIEEHSQIPYKGNETFYSELVEKNLLEKVSKQIQKARKNLLSK